MKHDNTLLKKALRGNPKAFGEVIRQEQEYLYRMAYAYTHNEDDALDAVQECVLRAYRNVRSVKQPQYFRTWLTRILINTAKELTAKRSPQVGLEELSELPAAEGLSAEERMDLHKALETLPEQYRDVITLMYFDGMKTREIAEQMNVPEGTVSSWLHRAKEQLRLQLKEEPTWRETL